MCLGAYSRMRVHVGAGDANIRKAPRFRCNRAAERGPDMSYELPPPGWYAAPHANNEQRYWDGAQWLEPTLEVAGDHSATALYPITAPTETPSEGGSKKSHKGWIIGGSVAAGVLVIGGIGGAIGLGSSEPEVEPWTTATPWSAPDDAGTVEDTEPSEDPVVMVIVPDVVGMTVEDALKELFGKGMGTPDISKFRRSSRHLCFPRIRSRVRKSSTALRQPSSSRRSRNLLLAKRMPSARRKATSA